MPGPRRSLFRSPARSNITDSPRRSLITDSPRRSLITDSPRRSLITESPRRSLITEAPRRTVSVNPVPLSKLTLLLDSMFLVFTAAVTYVIVKFLVDKTADDIVEFFEDDRNQLSTAVVITCLVIIGLYSVNFFYYNKHEIMMQLAYGFLVQVRQYLEQLICRCVWLSNLLAMCQLSQRTCMYVHKFFKFMFLLGLLVYGVVITFYLCTGGNIEYFAMDAIILLIYYLIAFSQDNFAVVWIIADFSYSLLYAGVVLLNFKFNVIGCILINVGVGTLILSTMWYFLKVPIQN